MNQNEQTFLTKDLPNKKITVTREFEAPVDEVWKAWTEQELLDRWWAPKPWRAQTKSMDLRVGGVWMYCMVGPNNEQQWCRVEFLQIDPGKSFSAVSKFANEDGEVNNNFPAPQWKNAFSESNGNTKVVSELTFDKEEDLEQLLGMGFEEGFAMAHNNLDELLAK